MLRLYVRTHSHFHAHWVGWVLYWAMPHPCHCTKSNSFFVLVTTWIIWEFPWGPFGLSVEPPYLLLLRVIIRVTFKRSRKFPLQRVLTPVLQMPPSTAISSYTVSLHSIFPLHLILCSCPHVSACKSYSVSPCQGKTCISAPPPGSSILFNISGSIENSLVIINLMANDHL